MALYNQWLRHKEQISLPTVESSGTDIYYEVNGEGPAILFAHGAGGNAAIWFQQVAHFNR